MPIKRETTRPRRALDRSGWIEAAIDALAEQCVHEMRVEVLAKNFGVTKGSLCRLGAREEVKVAAVALQRMDADEHPRIARVAPFGV